MDDSEKIELLKQAMIKLFEAEKLIREAGGDYTYLLHQLEKLNEGTEDSVMAWLEELGEDSDNMPYYHDVC